MQQVGKIVHQLRNQQESSRSPSDIQYKIDGKPIDLSSFDADRYWRKELIKSMQEIEPRFVVDERNKKLMKAIYLWTWKSENGPLDVTKGLLLWGPLGVGKSVLLRGLRNYEAKINRGCFANMNDGLGFVMASAAELSLMYAKDGQTGIDKYINPHKAINLAIDEVGREPLDSKHFGTNINAIQLILQLRYEYRHQAYTHMTTNLNPDTDFHIYGDYIADRVKEMFNVIEITGESRR